MYNLAEHQKKKKTQTCTAKKLTALITFILPVQQTALSQKRKTKKSLRDSQNEKSKL